VTPQGAQLHLSNAHELITLAIAQVFMGLPNDCQFLALAGYGSRTCSPTCHVSRATTCVCARSPHRFSERSTTSLSARRGGAISCCCSIRPRSPARPRARRFGAPSSRGSQPTARSSISRATSRSGATSGAFASICSARATVPRCRGELEGEPARPPRRLHSQPDRRLGHAAGPPVRLDSC
jgi:hypothetical protein